MRLNSKIRKRLDLGIENVNEIVLKNPDIFKTRNKNIAFYLK